MKMKDMKAIIKMIKEKGKVDYIIRMEIFTQVNGKTIKKKDMEYTIKIITRDMKVNGKMINLKEKELFIIITAVNSKVILKMVLKKVKELYI